MRLSLNLRTKQYQTYEARISIRNTEAENLCVPTKNSPTIILVFNMSWPTKEDLRILGTMSKEKLLSLFFLHIKNLWRVDGLYFLGIEEKFGTKAATEIDASCWKIMGKIEARELKEMLDIKKNHVAALIQTLRKTSWSLYQTEKESEASIEKGVLRVNYCRTQETRISKGLDEFPCKQVRFGYLQSFSKEFNPNIEVVCRTCPPDPHPENLWCEWEFKLKDRKVDKDI